MGHACPRLLRKVACMPVDDIILQGQKLLTPVEEQQVHSTDLE